MTSNDYPHDVVVLIPTCNRISSLQETLLSLAACDNITAVTEVVVVNNGKREADDAIRSAMKCVPVLASVVFQAKRGLAYAINAGLDDIQSRYGPDTLLLKVDDDVCFSSSWVQVMRDTAARCGGSAILGGRITPLFPPNDGVRSEFLDERLDSILFGRYEHGDMECSIHMPPFGANLGFR